VVDESQEAKMLGRRARLVVLFLVLAAAAASLGTARAKAGGVGRFVDACPIASANATLNLDWSYDYQESAQSGGGAYALSFCGRYVADINVPSGYVETGLNEQPLSHVWVGGGATEIDSPYACNALTENIAIYKRGALATSFTKVASGTFKGTFSGVGPMTQYNPCSLIAISGDLPGTADTTGYINLAGTEIGEQYNVAQGLFASAIYRVAVSTNVSTPTGSTWVPVTVHAGIWITWPCAATAFVRLPRSVYSFITIRTVGAPGPSRGPCLTRTRCTPTPSRALPAARSSPRGRSVPSAARPSPTPRARSPQLLLPGAGRRVQP
jgi:hypothetical protein